MAKVKLTAGRVEAFICPDSKAQAFLWDSDAPGFALRATAGAKSYIFQSRLDGKSIRLTIGDVNVWSIDKAREKARSLQIFIDDGRDPRAVKAEVTAADVATRQKAKQDAAPALDAWTTYIQARTSKWSPRHKADHETMSREGGGEITRGRRKGMADKKEPGILRPLLELPLQAITRDKVAAWLEPHAIERPTRARLAVSLLATFINWCADTPAYRGQVHTDACVRMKKDLPKSRAKDDCLQREQLRMWFDAVRKLSNPVISAYLQAALLTGARREEIAAMRWADIDFQWDSMTIRDKVEGARTIGLTPYVKALLLDLRRINNTPPNVRRLHAIEMQNKHWKPAPWVFASPTAASGRIQEPRIAHNRAITAAGLPHLTIHGLRRSFGTLAEWVECPAGIVAQIQGHKPSATAEKHYRRRPLDLLRMWHTKIEGWILEQAGIEQPQAQPEKLKAVTAA